ncbi:MAG: hypothetical protein JXQ67_04445 [Campylobacterales bacterium]|nr:hypothetical protein [Campylobacterales bacterium]
MGSFIDVLMLVLFFLFMLFIFGGYHKNKSLQREKEEKSLNVKEKN